MVRAAPRGSAWRGCRAPQQFLGLGLGQLAAALLQHREHHAHGALRVRGESGRDGGGHLHEQFLGALGHALFQFGVQSAHFVFGATIAEVLARDYLKK